MKIDTYISYNHDFATYAEEIEGILKPIEQIRVLRDTNIIGY